MVHLWDGWCLSHKTRMKWRAKSCSNNSMVDLVGVKEVGWMHRYFECTLANCFPENWWRGQRVFDSMASLKHPRVISNFWWLILVLICMCIDGRGPWSLLPSLVHRLQCEPVISCAASQNVPNVEVSVLGTADLWESPLWIHIGGTTHWLWIKKLLTCENLHWTILHAFIWCILRRPSFCSAAHDVGNDNILCWCITFFPSTLASGPPGRWLRISALLWSDVFRYSIE